MISLYAQYVNEREGLNIIEKEHGYITYSFLKEGSVCFIENLFVVPHMRRKNYAKMLASNLIEITTFRKCKVLIGSVCLDTFGADTAIKVIQKYGMKVSHLGKDNMIYFKKEI